MSWIKIDENDDETLPNKGSFVVAYEPNQGNLLVIYDEEGVFRTPNGASIRHTITPTHWHDFSDLPYPID